MKAGFWAKRPGLLSSSVRFPGPGKKTRNESQEETAFFQPFENNMNIGKKAYLLDRPRPKKKRPDTGAKGTRHWRGGSEGQ